MTDQTNTPQLSSELRDLFTKKVRPAFNGREPLEFNVLHDRIGGMFVTARQALKKMVTAGLLDTRGPKSQPPAKRRIYWLTDAGQAFGKESEEPQNDEKQKKPAAPITNGKVKA